MTWEKDAGDGEAPNTRDALVQRTQSKLDVEQERLTLSNSGKQPRCTLWTTPPMRWTKLPLKLGKL